MKDVKRHLLENWRARGCWGCWRFAEMCALGVSHSQYILAQGWAQGKHPKILIGVNQVHMCTSNVHILHGPRGSS